MIVRAEFTIALESKANIRMIQGFPEQWKQEFIQLMRLLKRPCFRNFHSIEEP